MNHDQEQHLKLWELRKALVSNLLRFSTDYNSPTTTAIIKDIIDKISYGSSEERYNSPESQHPDVMNEKRIIEEADLFERTAEKIDQRMQNLVIRFHSLRIVRTNADRYYNSYKIEKILPHADRYLLVKDFVGGILSRHNEKEAVRLCNEARLARLAKEELRLAANPLPKQSPDTAKIVAETNDEIEKINATRSVESWQIVDAEKSIEEVLTEEWARRKQPKRMIPNRLKALYTRASSKDEKGTKEKTPREIEILDSYEASIRNSLSPKQLKEYLKREKKKHRPKRTPFQQFQDFMLKHGARKSNPEKDALAKA